jgi:hypothetical protein
MSSVINKTKRAIMKIGREREKHLETLLSTVELITGSYTEVRVRCGKSGCHCEKEPVHPVTRLGIMENGKLKTKLVRIEDREWVSRMVETYKRHKKAVSELLNLNKSQVALLRNLIRQRNCRYE